MKDEALKEHLRLRWLAVAAEQNTKTMEKELRDIHADFRKSSNLRAFAEATGYYARYFERQDISPKSYSIVMDMVRRGYKRIDDGGFYLVVKGLQLVSKILLAETRSPGVTWLVDELENFFATIAEMVDEMEANYEKIEQSAFHAFQQEFIRIEPASHFHIKVFLRYQLYEMKMLRLSALFREDESALVIANKLLSQITNENNPMSFIAADWEEFKDVPNSVRNKVLNKCISISKGDLPLAAEHLDFSYRNLRSYITFKEVNRLGFFLDEQDTHLKQLEHGIRLMFFDLYKKGTIFEVVFDMPKFLVQHAKPGFSSQDLEEALSIKGTTAKKYIKIMMEIGLIKLERSVGRKHFYKLRKDNVMNRVGKDQRVLIG